MIQFNENSFKGIRQKTKALVPLTGSMEHAPLPQTNFIVLISSDTHKTMYVETNNTSCESRWELGQATPRNSPTVHPGLLGQERQSF